MSRELRFTTPQPRGPTAFPQRIGIIADLGQTHNSSVTLDHLMRSDPPVSLLSLHHTLRAVPDIASLPRVSSGNDTDNKTTSRVPKHPGLPPWKLTSHEFCELLARSARHPEGFLSS